MYTLSPVEVQQKLQAGEIQLIDVRETDEYAALSIPHALLVPLAVINKHPLKNMPTVFTCHTGRRTEKKSEMLAKLVSEAWQMEGGVAAWEKAGLPLERAEKKVLPLFRQIQIGAGSLILLGVIGSAFWHPMFWLTALVGVGLLSAGITGFCGLGLMLSAMPWNKH